MGSHGLIAVSPNLVGGVAMAVAAEDTRRPCPIIREPYPFMRSVADCDDGLGNTGNLAIEEILHLF